MNIKNNLNVWICAAAVLPVFIITGCAAKQVAENVPGNDVPRIQAAEKAVPASNISANKIQTSPKIENGKVIFKYPANENIVIIAVAGEFNNWSSSANVMTEDGQGDFSVSIAVAPGTYLYKFVVDGDWITDPYNVNTSPDGYGGYNSMIVVK